MLAQTPNTLYSSTSEMNENPAEPPVYCHEKATGEGSQTHLPSSASIASIVAEEKRGGCKTNERSEQRSSVCPRNNSISSKDSQCRQQKVNVISTFYDKGHMDVSEEGKGRRERRGQERREPYVCDEFQICKGKVTHVCGSERPRGEDRSVRCFENVGHGPTKESMW